MSEPTTNQNVIAQRTRNLYKRNLELVAAACPEISFREDAAIDKKSALLILLYAFGSATCDQLLKLDWSCKKKSDLYRVLSLLGKDDLIRSQDIGRGYPGVYYITSRGYEKARELLEDYSIPSASFSRFERSLDALFGSEEYVSPRPSAAASSSTHDLLLTDLRVALAGFHEFFPQYAFREEVAVDTAGKVYFKTFTSLDTVCSHSSLALRCDACVRYLSGSSAGAAPLMLYVEQDNYSQRVKVITSKFNNYSEYLFGNMSAAQYADHFLLFLMNVPERELGASTPEHGLSLYEYKQIIRIILADDDMEKATAKTLKDRISAMDGEYLKRVLGRQYPFFMKKLDELFGHHGLNTRIAPFLKWGGADAEERKKHTAEQRADQIRNRYRARRAAILRAFLDSRLAGYSYGGLRVFCSCNNDMARYFSHNSLTDYTGRILEVCGYTTSVQKSRPLTVHCGAGNDILFPDVYINGQRLIVVENISEEFTAFARMKMLLSMAPPMQNITFICACENFRQVEMLCADISGYLLSFHGGSSISRSDLLYGRPGGDSLKTVLFLTYDGIDSGRPDFFVVGKNGSDGTLERFCV